MFRRLYPWTTTRAPTWTRCGAYSTLRPSPGFYNIQKLNFCSKTNTSKTALINACQDFMGCYKLAVISNNAEDDVAGVLFKDWNHVVMNISYSSYLNVVYFNKYIFAQSFLLNDNWTPNGITSTRPRTIDFSMDIHFLIIVFVWHFLGYFPNPRFVAINILFFSEQLYLLTDTPLTVFTTWSFCFALVGSFRISWVARVFFLHFSLVFGK